MTHVPAAVESVATMAFASSGLLEVTPKRLDAGVPAIVALLVAVGDGGVRRRPARALHS